MLPVGSSKTIITVFGRSDMTGIFEVDVKRISKELYTDDNFDMVNKALVIGEKRAALFTVDGFCKDAVAQRLLDALLKLKKNDIDTARDMQDFSDRFVPYTETGVVSDYPSIVDKVLCGQSVLIIDGFSDALEIDLRTYPMRGITEPEKDRSLRGSRDSFVEALVSNSTLIRRRIRDPRLKMEYMQIGKVSKADVAICYLEGAASEKQVELLRKRLQKINVEGVALTSQALSELLVPTKFFNPLPKIKFTERPDYASACIIEGRVALIMDNSPSVMLFATSFADFWKEVDDYYFPPITGSFVRCIRIIVSLLTVYLTPIVLFYNLHIDYLPHWLDFLYIQGSTTMPLLEQFIILELLVDGLKLASINTPTSMTSSLGIIGGLLLSEFAVSAGWFVPDTIMYGAFVSITNYAQPSYEMGYAMKFARLMLLIFVQIFSYWGFVIGTAIMLAILLGTRTLGGRGYLYPIIPFDFKKFTKLFIRTKIKNRESE